MDSKDSDYEEEVEEDSDVNDESESNDDADFTPAGATKRITRGRKRKEKLIYKKGGKKMKKTIKDSEVIHSIFLFKEYKITIMSKNVSLSDLSFQYLTFTHFHILYISIELF